MTVKRRDFAKLIAAGSIGTAGSIGAVSLVSDEGKVGFERQSENLPRMVVGCQSRGDISPGSLELLARLDVYHMDPGSPETNEDGEWDLDGALRMVEDADKYGISIDAFHLYRMRAELESARWGAKDTGRSLTPRLRARWYRRNECMGFNLSES